MRRAIAIAFIAALTVVPSSTPSRAAAPPSAGTFLNAVELVDYTKPPRFRAQ
jgi:hypothetical protein